MNARLMRRVGSICRAHQHGDGRRGAGASGSGASLRHARASYDPRRIREVLPWADAGRPGRGDKFLVMEWARRLGRRGVADAAVAVILALFIRYTIDDPPGPSSSWPAWSAWPVAVVVSFPVAVRRRWPRAMLAFACATGTLATVAGAAVAGAIWASFVPTALVLYLMATTASVAWSVAGLGRLPDCRGDRGPDLLRPGVSGLTPAAAPAELPPAWPIEIGVIGVLLVTGWVVGAVVRWKQDTTARLVRHLAEAAVADERRRIARELHDVIGHSMSLIAVKATVANHVADARPQEMRAALAVIEQTSREHAHPDHRVLDLLAAPTAESATPASRPSRSFPASDLPELATRRPLDRVRWT